MISSREQLTDVIEEWRRPSRRVVVSVPPRGEPWLRDHRVVRGDVGPLPEFELVEQPVEDAVGATQPARREVDP